MLQILPEQVKLYGPSKRIISPKNLGKVTKTRLLLNILNSTEQECFSLSVREGGAELTSARGQDSRWLVEDCTGLHFTVLYYTALPDSMLYCTQLCHTLPHWIVPHQSPKQFFAQFRVEWITRKVNCKKSTGIICSLLFQCNAMQFFRLFPVSYCLFHFPYHKCFQFFILSLIIFYVS